MKNAIRKSFDWASNQTATVIWLPGKQNTIQISDVLVSIDSTAAGSVTLFFKTNDLDHRICKFNFTANGGAVVNFRVPVESYSPNESVCITTTNNCQGNVSLVGYERDDV